MQIVPVSQIDIRLAPEPWPLPEELRAAVPAYWQGATADNPHLWDGRILGLSALTLEQGLLRANAHEDAYTAFMLWRQRGFPDIGITHAFTWALIVSADGALLYGRMGHETANAGRVYPPGGSLEPRDVRPDGSVDVLGSIELELAEDTGLAAGEAAAGEIVAVLDGARVSVGRVFHFAQPATVLQARIRANIERQDHRELDDVAIIRSVADAERAGAVPYAVAVADAFASGRLAQQVPSACR